MLKSEALVVIFDDAKEVLYSVTVWPTDYIFDKFGLVILRNLSNIYAGVEFKLISQ